MKLTASQPDGFKKSKRWIRIDRFSRSRSLKVCRTITLGVLAAGADCFAHRYPFPAFRPKSARMIRNRLIISS